ncbi:hypothetical protein ACFFV7_51120 [Nonomuraea spiralis]|uniref:Uncharacterized protein n=1 Tax=Nonomuraea spiralis TaxID=46182 RepID=A0ABV5IYG7_9ACTN|nr:Holliday junction endonuclease [Nonomuraea spiralis]GGS88259.1 hypothetical protein GCM10010176_035020 [Nonomuraea spiralis]
MAPHVVGLDLSLTGTGIATADGTLSRVRTGDLRGGPRMSWIASHIFGDGLTQAADLVVVEGPSYGSQSGAGHHEAAGLWWHVIYRLHVFEVPYAVIPPSTLKKYAAGRGNATKPDMRVALLQRAGLDERDDNKVDAWWLRAAGLDHLGHPPVDLPKGQREALAKVDWPGAACPA